MGTAAAAIAAEIATVVEAVAALVAARVAETGATTMPTVATVAHSSGATSSNSGTDQARNQLHQSRITVFLSSKTRCPGKPARTHTNTSKRATQAGGLAGKRQKTSGRMPAFLVVLLVVGVASALARCLQFLDR